MSILSKTSRARQKVLGYPVDIIGEAQALAVIESAWQSGKGIQVVTLNAEMIIAAQKDGELDQIIRHADMIIPDGSGVVWALRLQGQTIDKLAGIDLASATLRRAAATGRNVALIGGRREILDRLELILPQTYPGLKIVFSHDGYFSASHEEKIVNEIAKAEPDLILVALGVPKQEYFIDKWQPALQRSVFIGVGGSFDVWSGSSKRAPFFMQRLHLEWLYRLIVEPWRWQRMLTALPWFGWQVMLSTILAPPIAKDGSSSNTDK